VILAHLANFAHAPAALATFFQDAPAEVGFGPAALWAQMGVPAKLVVILLFIMSIWSLAVMIDRALYFSAARIRTEGCRRAEGRPSGRGDQGCRSFQEVAPRGSCNGWPHRVPFVRFGRRDLGRADRELQARTRAF